jgi:hypothetical protein
MFTHVTYSACPSRGILSIFFLRISTSMADLVKIIESFVAFSATFELYVEAYMFVTVMYEET